MFLNDEILTKIAKSTTLGYGMSISKLEAYQDIQRCSLSFPQFHYRYLTGLHNTKSCYEIFCDKQHLGWQTQSYNFDPFLSVKSSH